MKFKKYFILLFIPLILLTSLVKAENSDYLKQESDHFTYIYYQEDEPIDDIINILEDNYLKLINNYNIIIKEKIIVEIYPDLKSFHENINLNINNEDIDWVVGIMVSTNKLAFVSPLNPGPTRNYNGILTVALHEFVHVVTAKINQSIPLWLAEGIAVYETNQINNQLIKYLIDLKKIPSLNELENINTDGRYDFSGTIIEYILNKYSYSYLINLIKNPNDFEKVLGVTKMDFYQDWKNYIMKKYK